MNPCILATLMLSLFLGGSFVVDAEIIQGRDPNRWEQEIKNFERSDRTNPPPRNAILFVGSSSIRIWTTLEQDFENYKVINRGFGGSEIDDAVKYANRIVLPYRPKTIVFYAGDNDLYAGKTPKQLFEHFKLFVFKVHEVLPKTKIFFVSVKPCPGRWHMVDKVMEINSLVEGLCEQDDRLTFVNVYPEMLGPDGSPKPELFKKDGVHLSEHGYALWTAMLKPFLRSIDSPPLSRR